MICRKLCFPLSHDYSSGLFLVALVSIQAAIPLALLLGFFVFVFFFCILLLTVFLSLWVSLSLVIYYFLWEPEVLLLVEGDLGLKMLKIVDCVVVTEGHH